MGRCTAGDICRKFAGCDSRPMANTEKYRKMYRNFRGDGPAVGRVSAGPPPTLKKLQIGGRMAVRRKWVWRWAGGQKDDN